MFKSTKRLLTAAMAILAVSSPHVASAAFFGHGPPAGSSTSGPVQPSIA
jgi:hypothetical protein